MFVSWPRLLWWLYVYTEHYDSRFVIIFQVLMKRVDVFLHHCNFEHSIIVHGYASDVHEMYSTALEFSYYIERTHAEIAHFPMRCILRVWEAWSHRPTAFQVLMMHQVGKCANSTQAWVLAFIAWPVRNIKGALQKSLISAHPFPAWIVPSSQDKH